MKATTWLCPVLTLLCATRIVCTAQRGGGYPLDYADTNMIQDDYFLEKRNKPSLSIVNPLDVLRQRLLLEIARRQMKENTRQVELNRAILKNVGKRILPDWPHYQRLQQLWLQQQQQQQHQQREYLPMQLVDYVPVTSIFDMLEEQRGRVGGGGGYAIAAAAAARESPPTTTTLGYDETQEGAIGDDDDDDDVKKSLDTDDAAAATKYQLNGNEIENEITNHMDTISAGGNEILPGTSAAAAQQIFNSHGRQRIKDRSSNNKSKHNGHSLMGYNGNGGGGSSGAGSGVGIDASNNDNNNNNDAGDMQLHYFYHLHRNHFARK